MAVIQVAMGIVTAQKMLPSNTDQAVARAPRIGKIALPGIEISIGLDSFCGNA